MGFNKETDDMFNMSNLILLIGYTSFIIMHIIITFLLGWDKWILVIMIAGVVASWIMHIRSSFTQSQRLWFYASFMMCSYFIYGTHLTSTYDLAIVMTAIMMLFMICGKKHLITFCQITYYITMTYDLIILLANGERFDVLLICRITMNYMVITMIAAFSKSTVNRWNQVLGASRDEIASLTESTGRLNDFLANVSHEIRTPVNAIIGLSNICVDKAESPELKTNLLSVRSAGRRIADQISDILDYSEIDRGNIVNNSEDYMLSSLINDLINDMRELIPDNLEFVIDVSPNLPATMHSDVAKLKKIIKSLVANGLKYTREGGVYLKITSEAREYGINLFIEVTDTGIGMSAEELERVCEGFYQSNSSRARSSGGLGLGLSIVNGFVTLLGGFMTIKSKPGEGTTVRVSIPQAVVDNSPCMSMDASKKAYIASYMNFDKFSTPIVREFYHAQAETIAKGLGIRFFPIDNPETLNRIPDFITHLFVNSDEYFSNQEVLEKLAEDISVTVVASRGFTLPQNSKLRYFEEPFYFFPIISLLNNNSQSDRSIGKMMISGIHALVVDDESMNLVVASNILKRYGMSISTAASGPESIELCRHNAYDIIFMDHMMGGMDGVEAMKKIKSDVHGLNHDTPMVALTANAMSSAKQMFLSEGFDGFISKPIELEEFERVMKKLLPKNVITYIDEDEKTDIASSNITDNVSSDSSDIVSSDSTNNTSSKDWLKQLERNNINVASGLSYCAEDKEFYKEVVLQFVKELKPKLMKLKYCYEFKDWKNYEILIHATKSTAKMIGADILSGEALQLEKAAGSENIDYIEENHQNTMDAALDLCKRLSDIFGLPWSTDEEASVSVSEDGEVMTFEPESDDDVMTFEPDSDDEIMTFEPESNDSDNDSDTMSFEPDSDDEIITFEPESNDSDNDSDTMTFEPNSDDDILTFEPKED